MFEITKISRDHAIIIGLYLSKFDKRGLSALGFNTFNQAFNVLGYSIGIKPTSIKLYRDEFDSCFPNKRTGWKRKIRSYCKEYKDKFIAVSFEQFTDIIKSFLLKDYEAERIIRRAQKKDLSNSIVKRLITGKAAEEYFKMNYLTVEQFKNHELKDMTNFACGFDFCLSQKNSFYYVEVKGLNLSKGQILMTDKEFKTAKNLNKNYCLFIVKNFAKKPRHDIFFNPVRSVLNFKRHENTMIQISYSALI